MSVENLIKKYPKTSQGLIGLGLIGMAAGVFWIQNVTSPPAQYETHYQNVVRDSLQDRYIVINGDTILTEIDGIKTEISIQKFRELYSTK
jgi:hypothetical protein